MVSLNFRASVPVFDANVGVGHRHDRPSPFNNPDELLEEMHRHGVERAVIYHVHGESISSVEGNEFLVKWADGHKNFTLQLHHSGCARHELEAMCAGNLERILGEDAQ